jgi:DNA-binding NarL/FixJ family response regulator
MTGEVLTHALNQFPGIKVVSRATSTSKMLIGVANVGVDVVIISAKMPEGELSGLEAVREMRKHSPDVKAIVLFDSPERQTMVEAFRAGAKGVFCPARSSFEQLCRCVSQVNAGQIWARSDELNEVLDAFSRQAPLRLMGANGCPLLTKREEDVVRLLSEGYQNREIARELRLSEHTVKNYLFRMFEKLGISSRVELVLYAVSSRHHEETRKVESKVNDAPCRKPCLDIARKYGPLQEELLELSKVNDSAA